MKSDSLENLGGNDSHSSPSLFRLDNLKAAYESVKKTLNTADLTPAVSRIENEPQDRFLDRLVGKLTSSGQPSTPESRSSRSVEHGDFDPAETLVLRTAVSFAVGEQFKSGYPQVASKDEFRSRVADLIERKFTKIWNINLPPKLDSRLRDSAAKVLRDASFPELAVQLATRAEALPNSEADQENAVETELTNVILSQTHPLLAQIDGHGHQDSVTHVTCLRHHSSFLILFDGDKRFEWLYKASIDRLLTGLSDLRCDPYTTPIQRVDLSAGESLVLFDTEYRLSRGQHLTLRALSQSPPNPTPKLEPEAERSGSSRSPLTRFRGRAAKVVSILSPVNWVKWAARCQLARLDASDLLVAMKRRFVSLLSNPVRIVQLLCLAAVAVYGWIFVGDLLANRSGDSAVPNRPPGFRLGQYNHTSVWDSQLSPYGLYVPPHFASQPGPFPLIIFLHGYGQRSSRAVFAAGLPLSIASRFGDNARNGRFNFVAFFPIDPTGLWEQDGPAMKDTMVILEYLIERYNIDRDRIYLTGISNGGLGVWRFAEAYPDKWAAIAPVSASYRPDLDTIRHLPIWIYHGSEDAEAPVEVPRELASLLRQEGCDFLYTEIPKKGHSIFAERYDSMQLYDWFLSKRRLSRRE